jgi:hypothetical protein
MVGRNTVICGSKFCIWIGLSPVGKKRWISPGLFVFRFIFG